jgi:HD-like signal output (HDOD) protein
MIAPADLIELAEQSAETTTKAAWHSSISRAYYSVFHEARSLMRQLGFDVPRGEQAHAYLSLRLSNCGIPTIEHAGHQLTARRPQSSRLRHRPYD